MGVEALRLSTGICDSRFVLGKFLVPGISFALCENKYERRLRMEIEFYFKFKRKPKTKKVTVVVDER